MDVKNRAIFISFDGVAVSGITVEAAKLASCLNQRGFESFIDLGFDIKIDKGNFGRPYTQKEKSAFGQIFTVVRATGEGELPGYTPYFIEDVNNLLINGSLPSSEAQKAQKLADVHAVADVLSERIVETWHELGITHVVVENGTLPENIVYTHALYKAIAAYGEEKDLGCFVLWRDHDLMWNSETACGKYGGEPWPYAVKPIPTKYINYVTLNDALASKLSEWSGVNIDVMRNCYCFEGDKKRKSLRPEFGISENDILIARTTRLVPVKRLERDIYLTKKLNELCVKNNKEPCVYLIIAGGEQEDARYFTYLKDYVSELGMARFVHFIGALQHDFIDESGDAYTVQDLYESCDIVSFLTSYDYDSYGNPIGEAISHQRCYIATRYEYYDEVYGQYGFQTELMTISADQDGWPNDDFVQRVYGLVADKSKREFIAKHNFHIGEKLISNKIFGHVFNV
ncbi:glycosyl transferase family 2 [Lonsdalea quercina]|uniref:glycosyl transferase family 2 n=1 Tax=Lonsdalea quercina TaxID=71657 RepID=UPI0039750121